MKTMKIYLHADRDGMYEVGRDYGIDGEALSMFSYACNEVVVELEVTEETGLTRIVKVDGLRLDPTTLPDGTTLYDTLAEEMESYAAEKLIGAATLKAKAREWATRMRARKMPVGS